VRQVLAAHEPLPAVVVDRGWNLVDANAGVALLTEGVAPELLAPPANALLLAAGYAPAYGERPLADETMAPVREALERLLKGHEPFPAVAVDRQWELVSANAPALALLTTGVAPSLLEPPANTLRISLHPDGLAPRIANLAEYSSHLLHLVEREAAASGDPALIALHEELRGYPGVDASPVAPDPAGSLFIPLRLRGPDETEPLLLQHDRPLRNRPGRDRRRAGDRIVLPGRRGHGGAIDAKRQSALSASR
jgi:hypothetical protein